MTHAPTFRRRLRLTLEERTKRQAGRECCASSTRPRRTRPSRCRLGGVPGAACGAGVVAQTPDLCGGEHDGTVPSSPRDGVRGNRHELKLPYQEHDYIRAVAFGGTLPELVEMFKAPRAVILPVPLLRARPLGAGQHAGPLSPRWLHLIWSCGTRKPATDIHSDPSAHPHPARNEIPYDAHGRHRRRSIGRVVAAINFDYERSFRSCSPASIRSPLLLGCRGHGRATARDPYSTFTRRVCRLCATPTWGRGNNDDARWATRSKTHGDAGRHPQSVNGEVKAVPSLPTYDLR